jgi:hypothetical protein
VVGLLVLLSVLGCTLAANYQITFYGSPDNDPPGSDSTAYNCGGRDYHASSGNGSYANPVTFASAPGEFKQCEIIYVPYIRKYARMEDTCAQCTTDFQNGKLHIDIWTGSTYNGGQTQINCEDQLTPDQAQPVLRSPGSSEPVDTTPLISNGQCTGHTYPAL